VFTGFGTTANLLKMSEENKVEDMGEFDIIVCGTSVKECFLSGILSSCDKKKILNIDRNDHYGGEGASFNLDQVYKKFKGPEAKADSSLGRSGMWSIDLAPKFLIGDGALVKCLGKLIPQEYMQYATVGGSFVLNHGNSGTMFKKNITANLNEVPTTAKTAMNSPLVSMKMKVQLPRLLMFIVGYDPKDEKTHKKMNLKKMTMAELYTAYGINEVCKTFIGHAIALQSTDDYLNQPALSTVLKIQTYCNSLQMFEKSPYLYPTYGLGNIADSFSRLGAIYGCTFITCCQDLKMSFADDGKFTGISFAHAIEDPPKKYTARAPIILADPSYFPENQSTVTGQICRSIVILERPMSVGIKKQAKTVNDCQIIIPGSEAKRKSDIYVSFLSASHNVCPDGKYFAVVSTMNNGATVTDVDDKSATSAAVTREIKLALDVLSKDNKVVERFDWMVNERAPIADLPASVYMTKSMDAASHFQDVMTEVFGIYKAITGKEFDVESVRSHSEIQEEAQKEQAAAQAAATE
jgi:Rab GDP dissociation inhibitor